VEFDTLEYIDWFNNRPLHGRIGHVPPAEFEEVFYASELKEQSKAECLYATQGGSLLPIAHLVPSSYFERAHRRSSSCTRIEARPRSRPRCHRQPPSHMDLTSEA